MSYAARYRGKNKKLGASNKFRALVQVNDKLKLIGQRTGEVVTNPEVTQLALPQSPDAPAAVAGFPSHKFFGLSEWPPAPKAWQIN